MFRALSLVLATFLLPISIVASPVEVHALPVTLPLAKRAATDRGPVNLVQNDQSRAAALHARVDALTTGGHTIQSRTYSGPNPGSVNASAANPTTAYLLSVGIGSPPTYYDLMVDITSSNTWVGNNKPYKSTSTSKNLDQPIMFPSVGGFLDGESWLDTLAVTPDLVVTNMNIGVASTISYGFSSDVDGLLGLCLQPLTAGTFINDPMAWVPTVSDNLFNQGVIPVEVLSLSLGPPNGDGHTNAELTFGGTDSSKYTGQISYAPLRTTSGVAAFWGLNMTVTYGDQTLLESGATILDIGQTLISLAPDAYAAYKSSIGATEDEATKMLMLTVSQYDNLQNLNFNMGSQTLSLVPNAQIWPRALNSYIGGSNGAIYSVVNQLTAKFADIILGTTFLERFYTVLDTTRSRVGFATTSYTNAIVN